MTHSLEQSGRTVDEAVNLALERLDAGREQVEIEIVDEGNRGFLGLGSRDAVVRVRVIPGKPELVRDLVLRVLEAMGYRCKVDVDEDDRFVYVSVDGDRTGLLIGRHGQTIDSLQYLLNIMAGRISADSRRVIIDVAGYRRRRQRSLEALARRLASRARRQGSPVSMDPMPAHERRLVHLALKDMAGVSTASEGREPYRKVVITPRG